MSLMCALVFALVGLGPDPGGASGWLGQPELCPTLGAGGRRGTPSYRRHTPGGILQSNGSECSKCLLLGQ